MKAKALLSKNFLLCLFILLGTFIPSFAQQATLFQDRHSTQDHASHCHIADADSTVVVYVVFEQGAEAQRVVADVKDGKVFVEGGICLGYLEDLQHNGEGRSLICDVCNLWTNATIPYQIDPDAGFSAQTLNNLATAINQINTNTNLTIVERTTETDYINIINGDGCWSWVGMDGGLQELSLEEPGCGSVRTIAHEFFHAAGVWHEQSREDRDDFVMIHFDNVEEGQEHNFDQHITDGQDVGPYDFSSIMHYYPFGFSANGLPTITLLDGVTTAGIGGPSMTDTDILGINTLYPLGTGCPPSFDLSFNASAGAICEGQEANLMLNITNGTPPFTVEYTVNGGSVQTWNDVGSTASFPVSPVVLSEYTIVQITDSNDCTDATTHSASIAVNATPIANPAGPLFECEAFGSDAVYDLTSLENTITDGTGDLVLWFTDVSLEDEITDTQFFFSQGQTVYALVDNGLCTAEPVPVELEVHPSLDYGSLIFEGPLCAEQEVEVVILFEGNGAPPYSTSFSLIDEATDEMHNYTITDMLPNHETTIVLPPAASYYDPGHLVILDANGCASSGIITLPALFLEVHAADTPSFSLTDEYCIGAVVESLPTVSDNGIAGTWSPAVIDNEVSGTYVFTPNGDDCAEDYVLEVVIVNALSPSFSLTDEYCIGAAVESLPTISDNGIAGTWSPAVIDNEVSGTYVFTPNGDDCAEDYVLEVVIVNALSPSFSLTDEYCIGAAVESLPTVSDNGIAGTWSPAVIDNEVSGTYVFTPNGDDCAEDYVLEVAILTDLIPSFSLTDEYCIGAAVESLPTVSDNGIAGTWSPAVINNEVSGTYVFTPNGDDCAEDYVLEVVIVNALSPSFSLTDEYCIGATVESLPTVSDNGIAGTWSPAVINNEVSGTYVFTPNGDDCAEDYVLEVAILTDLIPSFSLTDEYCIGAAVESLPTVSGNGIAGTWSPAVINNEVSGTYVFTPTAAECMTSYTLEVAILTTLTPSFSLTTEYCPGAAVESLPTVSDNGIAGTWSPAVINNEVSGTYVFSSSTDDCVSSYTLEVSILTEPTPIFNLRTEYCEGATVELLPTVSDNGIAGSWSPSEIHNEFSGNYTFTPNNIECANTYSFDVAIVTLPVANPSSLLVCNEGSDFAFFDLRSMDEQINGGVGFPVTYYTDAALSNIITMPENYYASSDTIYATIGDDECISLPVAIPLTVGSLAISCAVNDTEGNAATVSVLGGMPPYTLTWSGAQTGMQENITSSSVVLEDLAAGNYTVELTDANNCMSTCSFTILASEGLVFYLDPSSYTVNEEDPNLYHLPVRVLNMEQIAGFDVSFQTTAGAIIEGLSALSFPEANITANMISDTLLRTLFVDLAEGISLEDHSILFNLDIRYEGELDVCLPFDVLPLEAVRAEDPTTTIAFTGIGADLCLETLMDVSGIVRSPEGVLLDSVAVHLLHPDSTYIVLTNSLGQYHFVDIPTGDSLRISPQAKVNEDTRQERMNGINIIDLVRMVRHINMSELLPDPYAYIAADINNSSFISIADVLELQSYIISSIDAYPNNTYYRFIDAAFDFVNPLNPWETEIPTSILIPDFETDVNNVNFIGVKIGDVY